MPLCQKGARLTDNHAGYMIMIMTSDVMTNVADAYQKKALSLLTIMLDKYIHRCVFYPSGTIQKLSDVLSLLSLMLFSSVPIGILGLESLIQATGH